MTMRASSKATLILAAMLAGLNVHAATNGIIRCVADLRSALEAERIGERFDITATITFPCNSICCTFGIEDDTGAVVMREDTFFPKCPMKAGDRVRLCGNTFRYKVSGAVAASDSVAEIISHGPPPKAIDTSIPELLAGRHLNRLVRFTGTVRDAFVDEIDPLWGYLILQDGEKSFYATFTSATQDISALNALIGARVRLTGLYPPYIVGSRQTGGMLILLAGFDDVEILQPAPKNPFDVPLLGSRRQLREAITGGMDRRRTTGRVIAVWHGDRILLQTSENRIVRVDLAERKPPEYGTVIEAVGNPETDLYRLNLVRAIWRPSATNSIPPESSPQELAAAMLLTDGKGKQAVQVKYHGQPIRITGIVRSLPAPNHPYDRLGLECDRRIIPIDASACPKAFDDMEIGCVLEVSGICLIETENWRPNAPFPHVDGVALVVRTPEDVRVLSRPPWWTPKRLLAVIGALIAALAGIFLWNRSLNRLAERRGRELSEESVAHIAADLKVGERTRLAIELHDALSQNLTGVSLEIATAAKFASQLPSPQPETGDSDPETRNPKLETLQHLDIAARSLKSCRDELRNCLWDLRNYALEAIDMNDAVRRTLKPYVADVDLAVRFNVPREKFSDNTAHALLRIIRELVQNAIRHGHAQTVKIAGCLEDERLFFSVADDGCGFDPASCPGVQQGHFGLQGIRERVNRFGGEMSVASEIGKGSKVSISITMKNVDQDGSAA